MNLNPVALLNRFLKRGGGGQLAAQVYAHAIGQPLLVHPQMGEQIIGAYMRGGIEARPPTMTIGELAPQTTSATGVVTPARNVAVLNVSGGLVNRYEGDFCDPGPLSYESLRSAFDASQSDPTVEAVVMRIESPGGMGSGLFDLADHIHASRGKKPIYAVIDDYAYSAAYALAAACDQVWITRTGGAGSVGVIVYHVDQSGFDSKIGVKVTAVYAGAHKNDMTPHAPLSAEAQGWLQGRMDSMRALFAESVAKYRSLKVEDVMATEAQVYQGADAVAVGFADRLGTYAELMAEISAGSSAGALPTSNNSGNASANQETTGLTTQAPADNANTDPQQTAAPDLSAYTTAVMGSALPAELKVALATRGPVAEQSPADAIAYATSVRDICAAAQLESCAADYVKAGVSIEVAREQLAAARIAGDVELSTSPPQNRAAAIAAQLDPNAIYAQRRAKTQGATK